MKTSVSMASFSMAVAFWPPGVLRVVDEGGARRGGGVAGTPTPEEVELALRVLALWVSDRAGGPG